MCSAVFATLPQELHGLLWVWPDASAEGIAAAATAQPCTIPELDIEDEWEPRTDWFMREVPISMETVVENVSETAAASSYLSQAFRPDCSSMTHSLYSCCSCCPCHWLKLNFKL